MSSKFTPSQAVDVSKEKDWPMHLGMLDWDDTRIVFTKRSLVEFLRYTGVTVDPGFTNIQKLPRYAKFGKLDASSSVEEKDTPAEDTTSADDALSTAPPRSHQADDDATDGQRAGFKPTRRVRTTPGGTDSIGSIFSDEDEQNQFVPTRRVRQRPGGQDNIEGLF